jgi:hypothetical protein
MRHILIRQLIEVLPDDVSAEVRDHPEWDDVISESWRST